MSPVIVITASVILVVAFMAFAYLFLKKNNPSKKGRINSDYNIQKSIEANTKVYEIIFPNGEIKEFKGQKEIISYFKEYINKDIQNFIKKFDSGEKVKPFVLEVSFKKA